MGTPGGRGSRSKPGWGAVSLALGIVALVIAAPAPPTSASAACDAELLRARAQQTFPEYQVETVRFHGSIATLRLFRREGAGTFTVALRTEGSEFFTSVMARQLDAAEHARVSQLVAGWYEQRDVPQSLGRCSQEVSDDVGDSNLAVRRAAEAALGDVRLGSVHESWIVLGALVLSLAIVLLPGLWRPSRSTGRAPTARLDLALVLGAALVALSIAAVVAWRMAPETDEVVTLGARHETLSSLLSWNVGGEPFNPPGTSAIFALWLRVASGFFWARVLSIALIPLTALAAYRAGTAAAGRYVGLSFAGLLILAPAYLRLAAIARAYALIAFSLCLILAVVTRTKETRSCGGSVGVAGLLALWVSYLLWPLALAAPWMARLDRRDRLRLTGALALMAAAFAPRIANGFTNAMNKTDLSMFEIHGPSDALGYALAMVGQAPPLDCAGNETVRVLAGAMAAVLILAAIVGLWRSAPRQLRDPLLVLGLVVIPVLALLGGGHGIRDRHVIAVHVALTLLAATGLGLMISGRRGSKPRMLGWFLAIALAVVSAYGNGMVVRGSEGWIGQISRLCAGADLLMIVPRSAQLSVHAMLTGDSPLASATLRWPPVCESDTEWWCRRVNGLQVVSVDEVTDDVVAAASAFARSIWIFEARREETHHGVPPRVRGCEPILADSMWSVFSCAGTNLRPN